MHFKSSRRCLAEAGVYSRRFRSITGHTVKNNRHLEDTKTPTRHVCRDRLAGKQIIQIPEGGAHPGGGKPPFPPLSICHPV